ncbi:MAG: hypothetical protein F2793_06660 [Actinobacteria bacterium]|uniref:Unannotated protein n=1 Tax=freshwater metagenome TaxID=449393 RepID=A0A6J7EID8_9ZZZZ|nr:hypothetical protein [Actinomycetota bacterium]
MNRKTLAAIGAAGLLTAITVTGCSSGSTTSPIQSTAPGAAASQAPATQAAAASAAAASAPAGVVLPVTSNPIVNTATAPNLEVTFAGVEDLVDPATGAAIDDRLMLTLKNTGTTPMTGLEVYYEMTDVVTTATEAYYQKLDGVTIPAGQETTVYFDNQTEPGHFPENEFSLFRASTNEVDFAIQVSAPDAKIATATAVKATGTGEKVD